jgi:tetratricopeptide (TPR) repeat protein
MRNKTLVVLGLVFAARLTCATAAAVQEESEGTEGIPLQEAIEQSAGELAAKLPGGTRVAIVGFSSENQSLSEYIMDELTGALADGNLEVADRRNLASVYKELGFQMSVDVSGEEAVSIGKSLGAPYVITGQLVKAGNSRRFRLFCINVETSKQETVRLSVRDDRGLRNLIADLGKAPALAPSANYGEGGVQPKTAGAFLDRGLLFSERGDYDNAIAEFTEAIKLNPDYTNAYTSRGDAYYDTKDYDRAIEDYNTALRIDPHDAAAYNNRGVAYKHKGLPDRAIEDYNAALRYDSHDAVAYNNRGGSYLAKVLNDLAIEDYSAALRIDPHDASAKSNLEAVRKARGH